MIVRTYECTDCKAVFEVTHDSGDEGDPDCPNCSRVLEWRPTRIAIGGSSASKAVDITQKIMEQDYGLANFKDNNREGDVGYIDPTRKTASESEKIEREIRQAVAQTATATPELQRQADNFFGGQSVAIGQNRIPVQTMIAMGKTGPGANVDPMAALHRLGKEGKLPNQYRIIARSK